MQNVENTWQVMWLDRAQRSWPRFFESCVKQKYFKVAKKKKQKLEQNVEEDTCI